MQQHDGVRAARADIATRAQALHVFLRQSLPGIRPHDQPVRPRRITNPVIRQRIHSRQPRVRHQGNSHRAHQHDREDPPQDVHGVPAVPGLLYRLRCRTWHRPRGGSARRPLRWPLGRSLYWSLRCLPRRQRCPPGLVAAFTRHVLAGPFRALHPLHPLGLRRPLGGAAADGAAVPIQDRRAILIQQKFPRVVPGIVGMRVGHGDILNGRPGKTLVRYRPSHERSSMRYPT